ncbi:MAG TPA: ubiquinol-cytochrome C chaperone family protein [Croceibacterium sp.]|nr:ubiquinol-cytochrome C chaperone family protein [Croceibacterium sp.]
MSKLARFFRSKTTPVPDPREALRPLWHKIVELSRDPAFYRDDGVADTVAGRFDMITVLLSVVLMRFERDRVLAAEAALLTELFVEDMDGQLRESGVGDMVVGKHVGRLVSVLGGRLGALREARASRERAALEAVLARNVTLLEGHGPEALAARVQAFDDQVAALDSKTLLAGGIAL